MKLLLDGRELDAEFSVKTHSRKRNELSIVLESRGGSFRNRDYGDCLLVLLRALSDANATITSIEVVSNRLEKLSPNARTLRFRYPIKLNEKTDFEDLKDRIGDLQRRIGSKAQSKGGGNRTRRLQINVLTVDQSANAFIKLLKNEQSSIRQRAFVLVWNPAEWSMENYLNEVDRIRQGEVGQWSTSRIGAAIFPGDIVLLIQAGRKGRGLLGVGIAKSIRPDGIQCISRSRGFRDEKSRQSYLKIKWINLLAPDHRMPSETVADVEPTIPWLRIQNSGTRIGHLSAQKLLKSFERHIRDNSLEAPEVNEAVEEIERLAGRRQISSREDRSASKRRSFRLTAAQRKAIEMRAMKLAKAHLVKQGWSNVLDTSRGNPFDFYCVMGSKRIWVEVKGTTSSGSSVVLTRGEVEHHRKVSPQNCLIIVRNIQLTGVNRSRATGGTLHEIHPWAILDKKLKPIGFDYLTGL